MVVGTRCVTVKRKDEEEEFINSVRCLIQRRLDEPNYSKNYGYHKYKNLVVKTEGKVL
jgi:hypothetical protein